MREILSSGQHRLRIHDIKFLIQCETFSHAEGYVHDDGRLLAGGLDGGFTSVEGASPESINDLFLALRPQANCVDLVPLKEIGRLLRTPG